MNFLGMIAASPDPPGIELERWVLLIASHPNLVAAPPREGINPFTKGPYTYRPHPGTARIVIAETEVGAMDWAEDGSNQIVVWGEAEAVDPIARNVAAQLGGTYQPWRK